MIRHSGGPRKIRMRLPSRGKSGGTRVIYIVIRLDCDCVTRL